MCWFRSSAAGLQLLDPVTGKWVQPSADTAVLWSGTAATEMSGGVLPVGVHQVVNSEDARKTMWYELCTVDQVDANVLETGFTTE